MYPVIVLKSGREKSVRHRHPWVFTGAVEKIPTLDSGSIVQVKDKQGLLYGYGHFSKESQICVRIFEFTSQETEIDEQYWLNKFRRASVVRQTCINEKTNGYRLISAEGDFCPGLIVDVYHSLAVLQVLTAGAYHVLPILKNYLANELKIKYIYNKSDARVLQKEGIQSRTEWLTDPVIEPQFLENGYSFLCDPEQGQKTGFFLDQRENRELVGQFSGQQRVLNAFAYTGGFSIYALGAGATEVVSLDSSARAEQVCDANVALNFDQAPHSFVKEDCFDYLKHCPTDYFSRIILDPPAFAKHKSAVGNAYRGYKEINLQALRKLQAGGLLFTFSCSQAISQELFQHILFAAASDSGKNVRILQILHQGKDHPINIFHPEGEYLKGLLIQVD